MSHYRNFRLATYFVAHGAAHAERQQLQKDIDFFQHYLHLDNVYLEPFRDGTFASEEQVRMCKEVFEQNGIHVSGGITTAMPDPEGAEPKQRMFGTLCYNDEAMIRQLEEKYKDKGRLVIRASGTEPRVRVMIEGPDQREMDRDVYTLSKLIEKELN